MRCPCGDFLNTAEQHFSAKKAAQELERYRRKGAGPTTRMLRDGLARADLIGGVLLDVGAGIGALVFELLDKGLTRALAVDASSAYLAAAAEEAERRGRTASIQFVHGDFLSVDGQLPAATLVALDRVICCYPLYEPLLERALRHAEVGFALSYPKDRWFIRIVVGLENAMRARGTTFRTFVHPAARIQQIIERAGFSLVSRHGNIVWSADVFVKRAAGVLARS